MAKARKRIAALVGQVANPAQLALVADGGTARLLRITGRKGEEKLTGLAVMELPSAHLFTREMVSDQVMSDHDPHTVETERFAKRVARRLDAERRKRPIGGIIIIAAPHFLGVLRPQLSGPTRKAVTREVAKDLTRARDAQILRSALA